MTKQTPAVAELKACPFCGGRAITHRHPVRCWAVSCTQCDCKPTTTIRSTEAEAITAWNTRHAPEEHKAADGQGSVAEPQRELGGRSPERRSQEEAGSTPAGGATRPAPEPCGDGLADDTLVGQLRNYASKCAARKAAELMTQAADRLTALHQRATGPASERFLLAYVSQDAKVVGIEHDTDADWHEVQRAHEVLRDRLNERLAERENCPFKPAALPDEGEQ